MNRATRALLIAASLAPGVACAQATCANWLVAGVRTIEQGNGIRVSANFSQDGDAIRGTAAWTQIVTKAGESHAQSHDAGVEGTVRGDRFEAVMRWSNGSVGVYTGTIDARGVVAGTNYDRRSPGTTVSWHNVEPFRCRPKPNVHRAPPMKVATPKPITANTVTNAMASANGGFARPPARDPSRITPETDDAVVPEPPVPLVSRDALQFGDREFLYTAGAGGRVRAYVDRPGDAPADPAGRPLESVGVVASGWDDVTAAFPAWVGTTGAGNSFAVFGLTAEGALRWYRHDGFTEGTGQWVGPVDAGVGWNRFERIFAGGDGILYGILPDGTLHWFRYVDAPAARTPPRWTGPRTVGTGWGDFVHVFSGGEGIVYAVRADGTLLWYRHASYRTGVELPAGSGVAAPTNDPAAARWEGPRVIGSGWQQFVTVVSPGNGYIYAVKANGDVLWYFHVGHRDGAATWQGPVTRASGWNANAVVFAMMRGTAMAPAE